LVDAGRLGRKTGEGFYSYAPDAAAPEPATAAPGAVVRHVRVGGDWGPWSGIWNRLSDNGIEVARARAEQSWAELPVGAFLVPTLTVAHVLAASPKTMGIPEAIAARVGETEAAMAVAIRHAKAAGVAIGSGSDLLGPNQSQRGMELVLRAAIEGAMPAIVSATATNAKLLRLENEIGTIETGKLADLVAFRGDALADPSIFGDAANAVLVVKNGVVEKNSLLSG